MKTNNQKNAPRRQIDTGRKTFTRLFRSQIFPGALEKIPELIISDKGQGRAGQGWIGPQTKEKMTALGPPPLPRTEVVFDRPRTTAPLEV